MVYALDINCNTVQNRGTKTTVAILMRHIALGHQNHHAPTKTQAAIYLCKKKNAADRVYISDTTYCASTNTLAEMCGSFLDRIFKLGISLGTYKSI